MRYPQGLWKVLKLPLAVTSLTRFPISFKINETGSHIAQRLWPPKNNIYMNKVKRFVPKIYLILPDLAALTVFYPLHL